MFEAWKRQQGGSRLRVQPGSILKSRAAAAAAAVCYLVGGGGEGDELAAHRASAKLSVSA